MCYVYVCVGTFVLVRLCWYVCVAKLWAIVKSVSTRAPGSRATCHLTDFNETLPV